MANVLDTAAGVACWSCGAARDDLALFCRHCGKIQPASAGDFFQVLGIGRAFQIDLEPLEREFHRLSRKLHPDRFARASEQEREWSLANSSLLNDAYRTLKDPLQRTEYLLKLEGAEIGEEHAGKNRAGNGSDVSRVPADLLEEVFELNMQLEEMRASRKMGETDSQLQVDLESAKKKFDGLRDAVDVDLHKQWQAWDAGDAAAHETAKTAIVALLDRRRYLRNLVRDVTETLGAK
jgi:molecular chaperone HscB